MNQPCVYAPITLVSSGQPDDKDQSIKINQLGRFVKGSTDGRYYSASSCWTSAPDVDVISSQTSESAEKSSDHSFIYLEQVDGLIALFGQCCTYRFPCVDITEIRHSLLQLRNLETTAAGSYALIAAICFQATSSAEAADQVFNIPLITWEQLAYRLLAAACYPRQPNLNTIRAAYLLAVANIGTSTQFPDPGPISTVIRASQALGLHRDPSHFQLSSRETKYRRVMWWLVFALDIAYSAANALPPLIHPATFDVKKICNESDTDQRLLSTIIETNMLLSTIFEDIYQIRAPTLRHIARLDEKLSSLCEKEISKSRVLGTPLEKFIGICQRLCCYRLTVMLHQPYLRSLHWPRSSRLKALEACQKYITEYIQSSQESCFTPFRDAYRTYNVVHYCAIVLQDLIQSPNSTEACDLKSVVERCFSTLWKDETEWKKLASLKAKAWNANEWSQDVLFDNSEEFADWDSLLSSFRWDGLLPDSPIAELGKSQISEN